MCDRIERWEYGTVYRASRYPSYFTANLVQVGGDPHLSVDALVTFADQALGGLTHRRIDFDWAPAAEPFRTEFAEHGFNSTRLVWMYFDAPRPPEPGIRVAEVPYDAVDALRIAWHQEDFPDHDASEFHAQAREIRLAHVTRTLAVHEDSRPVGFAALDLGDDETEIGAVYVLPAYRGRGLGLALTQSAIRAAGDVEHLWICADDEDRPKQIYARLGFRPIATTMELLRVP